MKFVSLLMLSAVVFAGCEPLPEIPEQWRPRKIMGRDLYAPCHNGAEWTDPEVMPEGVEFVNVSMPEYGWGERIWINDIKWFNTPMPENNAFKKLPYTVWDLLGSRYPWNRNETNLINFAKSHPDRPFRLSVLDSWFPWFFKRSYDCDKAGFEKFRKEFPGFYGFTVLNELDGGFWQGYDETTNPVLRAQMESL